MIVVAGEALVDLVDEGGGSFLAVPGGSPANVAVGLARLGAPVQMLTRLSRDGFGRRLAEHLGGSGVELDLVVYADEPTPLAVAMLDEQGRASYSFYVQGTADRMWRVAEVPDRLPPQAIAMCLGSFALALEPGAGLLAALLEREQRRGEVSIVLDPNVRPALMGDPDAARARTERLVGLSDVVKVSDEDVAWLAPDADPLEVARGWATRGPQLVVVTQGPAGAYAVTSVGREVQVPAVTVDLVDTVGAGDAFTSGLVDGLRRAGALGGGTRDRLGRLDAVVLTGVIARAARVAGLTCARRGADPPYAADVDV